MSEVHGERGGRKTSTHTAPGIFRICIRRKTHTLAHIWQNEEEKNENEWKNRRFEYIACTHIRRCYTYNILSKLYYVRQTVLLSSVVLAVAVVVTFLFFCVYSLAFHRVHGVHFLLLSLFISFLQTKAQKKLPTHSQRIVGVCMWAHFGWVSYESEKHVCVCVCCADVCGRPRSLTLYYISIKPNEKLYWKIRTYEWVSAGERSNQIHMTVAEGYVDIKSIPHAVVACAQTKYMYAKPWQKIYKRNG